MSETDLPKPDILVVDDDVTLCGALKVFLEKHNYAVTCAHRGVEALGRLEGGEAYGVMILDVVMPDMNGFDVLNALYDHEPRPKIIVMSGEAKDRDLLTAFERGADYVLKKPFDLKQLKHTLEKALQAADTPQGFALSNKLDGWVELTASSYFEFLERFKNAIEVMRESDIPMETRQDIVLAIDELGRNAIEWGNEKDNAKQFSISYAVFKDEIVFKIEDEGGGFKPEDGEDQGEDNVLERLMKRQAEGKRPGGFGIMMVKKLMDKVVYNQAGNIVLISKRFGPRNVATPENAS